MTRTNLLAAGVALSLLASPALAQNASEEARTTYQVTFLALAQGASDTEWMKLKEEHFDKARKAAGLPIAQVHWIASGPWDLMLISEVPGGMGSLDTHNPPSAEAYRKAILAQEGSEAKVKELNDKSAALVARSQRLFTHTHP